MSDASIKLKLGFSIPDLFKKIASTVSSVLSGDRAQSVQDADKIKNLLAKYKQSYEAYMKGITAKLLSGEIDAEKWRTAFIGELTNLLMTSTALSVGGVQNMTKQHLDLIDSTIQAQLPFIDRFMAKLERTPKEKLTEAYVLNRASQYFGIATPVIEQATQISRGRIKLPFNPAQKTRCRNNCKCRWEWKDINPENGDWDVYWRLGIAEHCETCLNRAKVCNPLKIRQFQIITKLDRRELVFE